MLIESPYLATPGKKVRLAKSRTSDKGPFKHKRDVEDALANNLTKLSDLQERLYAGAEKSVLIVFQAMDTGGKDGAISHLFTGVNPQGCQVTSFKQPTILELAHDFLWRIHNATPPKGIIGIFNRSQYESVLVERVHNLVPKEVWSKRYDRINEFERLLADEGTIILKFFLHISLDEQKQRLQARLDDTEKTWKFDPNDLQERKLWDEYQKAYEDAVEKCSTESAPWYVVPSDHKWFRDWVIGDILVRTLEAAHLKYPKPAAGLDKIVIK